MAVMLPLVKVFSEIIQCFHTQRAKPVFLAVHKDLMSSSVARFDRCIGFILVGCTTPT